jgi:hypothetical protein
VNAALVYPGTDPAAVGWVDTVANPMVPEELQPQFHAVFDSRTLREALAVVTADGRAYEAIVDAEVVYARVSIEQAAGPDAGGPIEDRLAGYERGAARAAALLGEIAEIHHDALVRTGLEELLGQPGHERVTALAQAGTALVGAVPVAGPFLEFGANLAIETVESHLDAAAAADFEDRLDALRDSAAEEIDQAYLVVSDVVMNAMLTDEGLQADAQQWLAERPGLPSSSWFVDPESGDLRVEATSPAGRRTLGAWAYDDQPPGAGRTVGAVLAEAGLSFNAGQVRGDEG